MKVVIVDKRGPAKGSTTASTAMVLYEIDTPLTKLARKIGKPDADPRLAAIAARGRCDRGAARRASTCPT